MENTSRSLDVVLYIHYPLRFQKHIAEIKVLINSGNEVHAMMPAYASKLRLQVCQTNVKT